MCRIKTVARSHQLSLCRSVVPHPRVPDRPLRRPNLGHVSFLRPPLPPPAPSDPHVAVTDQFPAKSSAAAAAPANPRASLRWLTVTAPNHNWGCAIESEGGEARGEGQGGQLQEGSTSGVRVGADHACSPKNEEEGGWRAWKETLCRRRAHLRSCTTAPCK
jgi:hypothetical protein